MPRKYDSVDDCFGSCSDKVRPLMDDLRGFIRATLPSATEDLNYGVPVFLNSHGVPVLYLLASKQHVNFGFLRSAELSDPEGKLKGSGKPSKHIRILPGRPVDKDMLTGFVTQCSRIES